MLVGIRIHTVYSKKKSRLAQQKGQQRKKSEHIVNRDKNWLHSDVRNIRVNFSSSNYPVDCFLLYLRKIMHVILREK